MFRNLSHPSTLSTRDSNYHNYFTVQAIRIIFGVLILVPRLSLFLHVFHYYYYSQESIKPNWVIKCQVCALFTRCNIVHYMILILIIPSREIPWCSWGGLDPGNLIKLPFLGLNLIASQSPRYVTPYGFRTPP